MFLLYTDFGLEGPYLGQMQALLAQASPQQPVINLMADAPCHNPLAAGYLLAALVPQIPVGSIVIAVVDPGVGGERKAIMVKADDRWYVGPDNGLLDRVCADARSQERWEIIWRPETLSSSFHGRDLFTPVAIQLASDQIPPSQPYPYQNTGLSPNLFEIIYVDHFGNLFTGIKAAKIGKNARISCLDHKIAHAETFSRVQPGDLFWYVNSNGLVEIAANQTSAQTLLGAAIGSQVRLIE